MSVFGMHGGDGTKVDLLAVGVGLESLSDTCEGVSNENLCCSRGYNRNYIGSRHT